MYQSIMVPVDLAHSDKLDKALTTAADLAKHYHATLYYVGVTDAAPSAVAHNPDEFNQKLEQFVAGQNAKHGIQGKAKMMLSHDPVIDLDDTLSKAGEEVNADLVVMASHIPGVMDYVFSSNAGYLASHSRLSVFIVR